MPLSSAALAALFPSENFAFRLTLQRGSVDEFFAAAAPAALAERRQLVADFPERHTALREVAIAPLREFARLAVSWQPEVPAVGEPAALLAAVAGALEPDVVLLVRDAAGTFRLEGGAVCFPSAWDLAEKVGRTLPEIHAPVPGLNTVLAPAIDRFLERLRPGAAFTRSNWGLAATPALNLHPQAGRPRLGTALDVAQTWLRVEDQILFVLPETAAVVFGIRVSVEPLARVLGDPAARAGFHAAVATMPEAVAAYKGFGALRAALAAASAG